MRKRAYVSEITIKSLNFRVRTRVASRSTSLKKKKSELRKKMVSIDELKSQRKPACV